MSTLGKPTDQDLDQYPHVIHSSPHEWDPSVLDYSHPNILPGYLILQLGNQDDHRKDECGNIHHRSIHALSILSDTHTIFVKMHDPQPTTIDYNKLKPYFG